MAHSNAEVEHVFSAMNNIKSKLRNTIEYRMLTALLTIKLIRSDKCQKIGTLESYASKKSEELLNLREESEPQPSTSFYLSFSNYVSRLTVLLFICR